jgi:hypothetical protein
MQLVKLINSLFLIAKTSWAVPCDTTKQQQQNKVVSTKTSHPSTKPPQTTTNTQTTSKTQTTTNTQPPATPSTTPQPFIPIKSGTRATLTYFTDTVTQCYGSNIPPGNGLAINPLLLGFTLADWDTQYAYANANAIPWCGKRMNVTVNGKTYSGTIIDTCNPSDDGAFLDPNTGLLIGGKCDYTNVIDLYGNNGLKFLQNTVGDDFYQGDLTWVIY